MRLFIVLSLLLTCQSASLAQGVNEARDILFKGNGERIVCSIRSLENDRIQYVTGGRYLTTTYLQRLSRIAFGDGSSREIQPVVWISGEEDWQKVKVVSDLSKVLNLPEVGIIDVQRMGTLFSKQEKTVAAAMEQIKREAAKIGSHVVLIVDSERKGGLIELDGDKVIGIRSVAKFACIAYGF